MPVVRIAFLLLPVEAGEPDIVGIVDEHVGRLDVLVNHAAPVDLAECHRQVGGDAQLYVFVVIEHSTRRLAHINVTTNPSADWTLQQLREVVGNGGGHRYLIHDRDRIFAKHLDDSIRALGVEVLRSPIASSKVNSLCERVIGTARRECLEYSLAPAPA